MDFNLSFKLSGNTIIISKIKKTIEKKDLNNTNVINLKELKFSYSYILENLELVSSFLNVTIIKSNIENVVISTNDIAPISLKLINTWEHIKKITFKEDKSINMDIFMLILDNKYIESIDCFKMPTYLIERLDVNKKVIVNVRNKLESTSKFMKINSINSFSDIYYKKYIIITDDTDYEDIKTFINLNNRLKNIKIIKYSNELLTLLMNELVTNKKSNIRIEIEEKDNDLKTIYNSVNYLKKVNKDYIEENNISFKLNYSESYKKNNLFKEMNFKMFSAIIIFIIGVGLVTLMLDYYVQFKDNNTIEKELIDINKIIDDASSNNSVDDNESDVDFIDDRDTEVTTTKKAGSSYSSAYYVNYSQIFDELLKKNSDTVGYLSVNNTKINYPVVQASTNSYYLNRDFNKRKNSMGWIFMDYRNDAKELNKNTIIYGHNIKQGIMFGTLKYALNSSWYKKESNQVITFNTPTKNMKWRIFSIYRIPATEDYLKTEFDSNEEYMDFLNMLKNRSINNFNVELNESSKILTLSTCFSHTTRHVVHAVLESEEDVKTPE